MSVFRNKKKIKSHFKRNVCIALLAGFISVGSILAIIQAQALSSAKPQLVKNRYLEFQNSVSSVHRGNPCMNILGYFVTVCDKNHNPLGTAFTTVPNDPMGKRKSNSNLLTGRAGYSLYDLISGGMNNGNTTQYVDLKDQRFLQELRKSSGAARLYLFDMLNNKKIGYVDIEEVICTARATGNGISAQSGWVNTTLGSGNSDGTHYPINTQIRLKSPTPSTSDVISDLASLNNQKYWYKAALGVSGRLKAFEVNSSQIVREKCSSQTAIIAVNHFGSGSSDSWDLLAGGYHNHFGTPFKNMNVRSFGMTWGWDQNQIQSECYTPFLSIKIGRNAPGPVPPVPPERHASGDITTRVVGMNDNFNAETNILYSGQLGHFKYNYQNLSYRIEHDGIVFDSDGVPSTFVYDTQPNFNYHGTKIQKKSSHEEYTGSDYTEVNIPPKNGTTSLWAKSLIPFRLDSNKQRIDVSENDTRWIWDTVGSGSFRVNYNTDPHSIPGRSALWNDTAYTTDSKYIKIIPSDVEACDIRLKDAVTGRPVSTPYVGEYLIPVYYYRNNTDIPVTAIGFGDPETSQFLTEFHDSYPAFSIGAHSTVSKEGSEFRLLKTMNKSTSYFELSCSTWLDGFSRGDATWESDQDNNVYTKGFHVQDPLDGWFVEPNSNYREDTDVISSFKIHNNTGYDMDNGQAIDPLLKVTYAVNGRVETQTISASKRMVCPAQETSMVWFKWHVPKGARDTASFDVEMDPEKSFIDLLPWGDYHIYGQWTIDPEIVCETPDTAFAESMPQWFDVFGNKLDMSKSRVTDEVDSQMTWVVWQQDGTTFNRHTYSAGIPTTFVSYICPHGSPTATWTNNKWYMKSGYGFTVSTSVNTVTPGAGVTYKDYTNIQNCYTMFPEFMYDCSIGQAEAEPYFNDRYGFKQPRTANWIDSVANKKYDTDQGTFGTITALRRTRNGGFTFPVNSAMLDFVHYTPDWTPDGSYRVKNYAYDVWTPAGMLSGYSKSNEIRIRGTMYSDYYIAGN